MLLIEEVTEKLLQLNNSWYYRQWPSQIVIDYFEKIDEIDIQNETRFLNSDQFGAISGEITMLLEIYNPALTNDIQILQSLLEITREYQKRLKIKIPK